MPSYTSHRPDTVGGVPEAWRFDHVIGVVSFAVEYSADRLDAKRFTPVPTTNGMGRGEVVSSVHVTKSALPTSTP